MGQEENVDEKAYREWKTYHYTEMNDGMYRTDDGRAIDEADLRSEYIAHRDLLREVADILAGGIDG